ncbi:MAG: hypothetical protein JWR24_1242 [Actinoallomurus sp.]|jgi:hypothetical protein|nr:hypothetical protein [Actinoallomurus sp.]
MTITITIPPLALPGGLAETMRFLIPIMEPFALVIAGACGAGILVQIGLDLGLRLARHALRS